MADVDPATFLFDGPEDGPKFAFAHGAGAPMDSEFMKVVAAKLGDAGVRVVRFEFPYMAKRRTANTRPGPDRPAALLEHWRGVVEALGGGESLAIGGKSMGGRIASMVADEVGARRLVCFGYPFHPPGAPEKTRTEHLAGLRTHALILQGERDPFGTRDDVAGYTLSDTIHIEWLPGGNHDLAPAAKSGYTKRGNWETAIASAAQWILG